MGPPLGPLGFVEPRNFRGPIPNRWIDQLHIAARGTPALERAVGGSCRELVATGTTLDGVAHEAPLSVWLISQFAEPKSHRYAPAGAGLQMGAPVARQPTPSPAK
jgi:hypothetical protein